MKKVSIIKFSFKVHSFKHLYNNYKFYDLVDYIVFLRLLYYKIFNCNKDIKPGSTKSCLVRYIIDLEQSIITEVLGGVEIL